MQFSPYPYLLMGLEDGQNVNEKQKTIWNLSGPENIPPSWKVDKNQSLYFPILFHDQCYLRGIWSVMHSYDSLIQPSLKNLLDFL